MRVQKFSINSKPTERRMMMTYRKTLVFHICGTSTSLPRTRQFFTAEFHTTQNLFPISTRKVNPLIPLAQRQPTRTTTKPQQIVQRIRKTRTITKEHRPQTENKNQRQNKFFAVDSRQRGTPRRRECLTLLLFSLLVRIIIIQVTVRCLMTTVLRWPRRTTGKGHGNDGKSRNLRKTTEEKRNYSRGKSVRWKNWKTRSHGLRMKEQKLTVMTRTLTVLTCRGGTKI